MPLVSYGRFGIWFYFYSGGSKQYFLFFCEKDATYIKRIRTGQYTLILQKGLQKIKQIQASPYC